MISFHFQTAEEISRQMTNASNAISHAIQQPVNMDSRTTLTVNKNAQETNEQLIRLVQRFNEAFQITIKNIYSTGVEFQDLDQKIGTEINQSINRLNKLKDIQTYMKAKNG